MVAGNKFGPVIMVSGILFLFDNEEERFDAGYFFGVADEKDAIGDIMYHAVKLGKKFNDGGSYCAYVPETFVRGCAVRLRIVGGGTSPKRKLSRCQKLQQISKTDA